MQIFSNKCLKYTTKQVSFESDINTVFTGRSKNKPNFAQKRKHACFSKNKGLQFIKFVTFYVEKTCQFH